MIDKDGMPHPYIAREFYSPWGDFDVTISIDKKYVVGGTGILKNVTKKRDKKIWNFIANNVHDFVWAADPDYTHDILKVDEEDLELHFYYQSNNEEMKKIGIDFRNILPNLSNILIKNLVSIPIKNIQ